MQLKFPGGTNPLSNELNVRVLQVARSNDYRIYMVGGAVRDALLYKESRKAKDLDYAVAKAGETSPAFSLARLTADKLQAHFVPLDETNDTARVVLDSGEVVDFAGCLGGEIETDVHRRDFTINALVWNPEEPDEIIDYVGGAEDIKDLCIRAISENSIVEDPLRILRAFRFCASLKGSIEKHSLIWIEKHRELLNNVAYERINYELFVTLALPRCASEVLSMAQTGVLEVLFPELKETRRVTTNAFHHLGLFDHSIETIPQIEQAFEGVSDWVRESAHEELSSAVTKLAATKLACLLHDIGKPQTWEINEEGRHTFYQHDKLGADMCESIGERMKWSRPVEKLIVKLVRWHLRPGALFHQGAPTKKAVGRFYRSVGDDLPELMLLTFADFGATRGPGLMGENRKVQEENLKTLLAGYRAYKESAQRLVMLLDGNDVMRLLELAPGPIVGEILTALREAQEFKEVLERPEAERFVKNHYAQTYCK